MKIEEERRTLKAERKIDNEHEHEEEWESAERRTLSGIEHDNEHDYDWGGRGRRERLHTEKNDH